MTGLKMAFHPLEKAIVVNNRVKNPNIDFSQQRLSVIFQEPRLPQQLLHGWNMYVETAKDQLRCLHDQVCWLFFTPGFTALS